MHHIVYAESDDYPAALLIKSTAFAPHEIERVYVEALEKLGVNREDLIVVSLSYDKDKPSADHMRAQLGEILPALESIGTKFLYCADANYFKILTRERKAEPHLGYVVGCAITDYHHMSVTLGLNHKSLLYQPQNEFKLDQSLKAFAGAITDTYQAPGEDIIHTAMYPETVEDVKAILAMLLNRPGLTCDIETYGLDFHTAGIATIAFAWNQHEGVAFKVSHLRTEEEKIICLALLKEFFETYSGTLLYHKANFDVKIIIYTLWMSHPRDMDGLLRGLDIMTRKFHDTRLIAYLATNTTAENPLSLKVLAQPFAGNWAEKDIADINKIELSQLLRYNLIDALATFYVYNTYWARLISDRQLRVYNELMLPSLKVLIQTELTGLPLYMPRVREAKTELNFSIATLQQKIDGHSLVDALNKQLRREAMAIKNAQLKTKQYPLEHFNHIQFNPNSNLQKQKLLYDVMKLPVVDKTRSGQPATGAKTLKTLINHCKTDPQRELLQNLIDYGKAQKILTSFIPAFENAYPDPDHEGYAWLHGSFNLGGTVSGRLSSSEPNLQNIPSGSTHGKLIKSCFQAPPGWIFCGADFNGLEDMINALLTRDPNKIKVFTDGYDGHSMRAYSYFPEQLPDIEDTVESINSIEDKYPAIRQDSKPCSFALQYFGTWKTLVKNLGFSAEKAQRIEANYKKLYQVSMDWVEKRLNRAAKTGYVTLAFGLRLRTPLLVRTLRGHKTTPEQAEAEARTAGNALSGQSYGLLTNRAANAFMQEVWDSPSRLDILPVAQIHDAIYLCVRDDINTVAWTNDKLIQAMRWQELPELRHPEVKLGAQLELYYPSWENAIKLPNDATPEEITEICAEATELPKSISYK